VDLRYPPWRGSPHAEPQIFSDVYPGIYVMASSTFTAPRSSPAPNCHGDEINGMGGYPGYLA
jgi:hypothetical protein